MFVVLKCLEKRILEKEEKKVFDEEENWEKEEREFFEKIECLFNEENVEELFRIFESEFVMKLVKKESYYEENGKKVVFSDWELIGREVFE